MFNKLNHQFRQIDELLKDARKVLIAAHRNPDPDAVASVLVLHHIFKKRGIESFPYLPDPPPKNLNFLPGFFEVQTQIKHFHPEIVFCLDYGDFERLGPDILSSGQVWSDSKIITIDHHLESDQRGFLKIIVPEFSSTSEIIYYWISQQNIELDKEIATCLLTGIFSDSGGFYRISSSETLNIASKLLLKGVPFTKIIAQGLSFNRALSKAWGQALSRTGLDKKTGLAYSWVNFEDIKHSRIKIGDFDGICNLISACSPKHLGLFLIEYERGKIKGSLRSESCQGKGVAKIAEALGGGGHPYAAGFRQEGEIKEVLKKVINLIK